MNRWSIDELISTVLHPRAMRWSYRLIYGWFLINLALLFPDITSLWGENSVIMRGAGTDDVLSNFIYQLIYIPGRANFVILLHAIASLVSMFSFRFAFVPRMISWLTGLMLYFAAYPAFNSGYLAILLFAFFLAFTDDRSKHPARILLTNVLWFACFFQLVLIYAVSVGYKWTGTQWPSGTAIYYSFAIDRFSHEWLRNLLPNSKWIWMIFTWSVLLYQSLFPIIAWFGKWRMKLIVTGIVFHLLIAALLNLWTFGLAMIFAYIFLLPEEFFHNEKRARSNDTRFTG